MPRKVLLFANPIAGKGRGERYAATIETTLRERGWDVVRFRKRPDLVTREELEGADGNTRETLAAAAISIGGDGTLRSVAERLLRHAREAGTSDVIPPMLIVPLGTANLMGKHLGLRWHARTLAEQVAERLDQPRISQLDVGSYLAENDAAHDDEDANGQTRKRRLFLLMAGVGIDAHVVHELARVRRGPIDLTSYVLPAALAFRSYSYPAIIVEVDGQVVFGPAPGIAMIGNVREYGTGFPILPDARSDDGLLDICAMPCKSRQELASLLLHAVVDQHRHVEGVAYVKGKHVRVTSPTADVPVQVDGEAAGHTPLDIELLDVKLPFMV